MSERCQLIQHEADRQFGRVEGFGHLIEGGGQHQTQPSVEGRKLWRSQTQKHCHSACVPLLKINLFAFA